MDVDDNL